MVGRYSCWNSTTAARYPTCSASPNKWASAGHSERNYIYGRFLIGRLRKLLGRVRRLLFIDILKQWFVTHA